MVRVIQPSPVQSSMHHDAAACSKWARELSQEPEIQPAHPRVPALPFAPLHNVDLRLHLFDTLAASVLSHGCEVWGPDLVGTASGSGSYPLGDGGGVPSGGGGASGGPGSPPLALALVERCYDVKSSVNRRRAPAGERTPSMVSKRKGETDDEFRKREREVKREKRSPPSGPISPQGRYVAHDEFTSNLLARTKRGSKRTKPYGIRGSQGQLRLAEARGLLERHRLAGSKHCLHKVRSSIEAWHGGMAVLRPKGAGAAPPQCPHAPHAPTGAADEDRRPLRGARAAAVAARGAPGGRAAH